MDLPANTALESAFDEAQLNFIARHAKSKAIHEDACRTMPGGNTRTVLFAAPFPVVLSGGDGCRVFDVDGNTYIDFLGEFSAGIYGHSNEVIRSAIEKALRAGVNLGGHNTLEPRLSELLCARFPSLELVRFTNSGTEANLMAISAARIFTGRSKILVFNGGYHGGLLYFGEGGNPINAPYDFVVSRYNDAHAAAELIAKHAGELAAVLVEPMLGSGGCIPAEADFLQALREGTKRTGALLIFDEVMTSRLAPGGLQSVVGVLPDLTTLGKYLGGGMSFGAFGGSAAVMGMFDPRSENAIPHAGTFNNNVLTMAAGIAALTEVYTPAAATRLNVFGDEMRTRMNALCQKHAVNVQATGRGSMFTVHMCAGEIRSAADLTRSNLKLKDLFYFDMLEKGIWLARRGMAAMSLPIGAHEADVFLAAFEEFLVSRRRLIS